MQRDWTQLSTASQLASFTDHCFGRAIKSFYCNVWFTKCDTISDTTLPIYLYYLKLKTCYEFNYNATWTKKLSTTNSICI